MESKDSRYGGYHNKIKWPAHNSHCFVLFFKSLLYLFVCIIAYVHVCGHTQYMAVIVQLAGVSLRLSAFTHWAFLLAHGFFFSLNLYCTCMGILLHVSPCTTYLHSQWEPEEGVSLLELGQQMVVGYCVNVGSQASSSEEQQPGLLATESTLQSLVHGLTHWNHYLMLGGGVSYPKQPNGGQIMAFRKLWAMSLPVFQEEGLLGTSRRNQNRENVPEAHRLRCFWS